MKNTSKDLEMFKLFTKPVSQYIAGKSLLVISISICLLFAASALCSIEARYGSNLTANHILDNDLAVT